MNSPNTQNLSDLAHFLAADYFLNRPGTHDHMLMIANISRPDHLLCSESYENY
ncbi:peptidase [Klebsiella michiganensis]|nr:peptidase [Klebsiella michiganensis]MBW6001210.1 peptidase [Klebsiella michiganensis]